MHGIHMFLSSVITTLSKQCMRFGICLYDHMQSRLLCVIVEGTATVT